MTNMRLAKDIQHHQDTQWAVPLDSDNPTPSTLALADYLESRGWRLDPIHKAIQDHQ